LIEHPEYGLCVCELKDVGFHNRKEWENDEPPLKFAIQCQHQLAATGLEHAFIQGLIGRVPVIKHVPRNERFIDAMLGKLAEFWDYVERGELPPIDASAATGRILAKLWPEDSGATVVLPPESASGTPRW
jgi:predicted phage-related endonuclease